MTCVVGLVEAGKMLFASDTAGVSLKDGEIYSLENAKVFRSGPYLLGYTTSYRLGQILRYATELPEPPANDLERFMATLFVPALRHSLDEHGLRGELSEYGSLLVGVRGHLFGLGADLQVLAPSTPYVAVGSGRHVAYGALFALAGSGRPLRERAETALRAAQTFNPGVREPFTFVEIGEAS